MINNMKLSLKCLRYAYGIKFNLLLVLGFVAAGAVCYVLGSSSPIDIDVYGDFMLMCVSMVPAQLIFSLSASNMVLASPLRKKLQTSIPATVTWGSMMLVYLIVIAYRLIKAIENPELAGAMSRELAIAAVLMLFFMLYLGVAYKYFEVSVLMMVAAMLVMSYRKGWVGSSFRLVLFGEGIGGVALTALMGMGILAAGGFLQYLISLLVYRAPMAKMAQAAPLRREL